MAVYSEYSQKAVENGKAKLYNIMYQTYRNRFRISN